MCGMRKIRTQSREPETTFIRTLHIHTHTQYSFMIRVRYASLCAFRPFKRKTMRVPFRQNADELE